MFGFIHTHQKRCRTRELHIVSRCKTQTYKKPFFLPLFKSLLFFLRCLAHKYVAQNGKYLDKYFSWIVQNHNAST